MKTRHFRYLLIGLFALTCCLGNTIAQTNQAPVPTLESPYNTMYVHLYYLQPDERYQPEIAGRTIDLPGDSARAVKLAIKLKQVFDGNGLFVRLNMLPQEPDYQDTTTQKNFYTPFPLELPDVYLEKKGDKWYYSDQTVKAIPDLHRSLYPFGTDLLVDLFPEGAKGKFLGLATWQWAGIGILLVLTWLLHLIMSRLFRPVVKLLARSKYSSPVADKTKLWKVARLSSIVVLLWLLRSALPLLQLPVKTMSWLVLGLRLAMIAVIVWLGMAIIDVMTKYADRYATTTEEKLDEQLIPILRRMLKIIVFIGGLIYALQLLDVNVTALIAGVSIGGLALALAAQDTVKNLIGSAMIFFDKPFQIGDWVVANGVEGEIVEVGFRSTRLQTVDSSIITVPNNQISSAAVKNMGIRRYRLFKATLGVTYDTPPKLLEEFIASLRQMIVEHPLTKKDNYLVHFHSFGDSSLNIYFRTHMEVSTFGDEMKVREELAFSILKLAEEMGVSFAFPTRTVVVEKPSADSA